MSRPFWLQKKKTPIRNIIPRIDFGDLVFVAEILACVDPDPVRRRAHRRAKLATFPAEVRDRIRQHTNAVISARSQP